MVFPRRLAYTDGCPETGPLKPTPSGHLEMQLRWWMRIGRGRIVPQLLRQYPCLQWLISTLAAPEEMQDRNPDTADLVTRAVRCDTEAIEGLGRGSDFTDETRLNLQVVRVPCGQPDRIGNAYGSRHSPFHSEYP
jgi:hypothetical protein